jgi:Mg-chelatase subunit ChlD
MIRPFRTSAALALLACAALALAAPWGAGAAALFPAAPPQDGGEYVETPLSRAMEQMKGATRRLERVLQGDDAQTALALLGDFQAGVVAAKGEVPLKAAAVPEAEREAFVGAYRATMVKLLRVTCDLEDALLEGRLEDARKLYEGELKALQKPSHERFRDEE